MPDLITWPSVVLSLGVLFIIVFRRPIADLLGRTRKVGKGGLETYDNAQLPAPTDTRTEVEKFLRTYDNPLLLEQEGSIRMDLKNRKLDAPADSQQVLIRALAGTQILLHFERVFSAIFASQVAILNFLNSRPEGASLDDLRPFYEDARTRFPAIYRESDFESYLGFLQSFQLLDISQGAVSIKPAGREFLKWLVENGKAGPFHG